MTTEELPVPTATSLAIEGAAVDSVAEDVLLAAYLSGLRDRMQRYLAAGADADTSGIRDEARRVCLTLGRDVRIELPGESVLEARAVDLDAAGRLLVAGPDGVPRGVAAGDVTHVR